MAHDFDAWDGDHPPGFGTNVLIPRPEKFFFIILARHRASLPRTFVRLGPLVTNSRLSF